MPGGATADAQNIYVTTVNTPKAGKYWLLAQPIAPHPIQALGDLTVRKHTKAPSVGDRAIPSVNPTLKPGVKPSTVTTAEPPDTGAAEDDGRGGTRGEKAVRRHVRDARVLSVADLRAGRPGRAVGGEARKGSGVEFIHIEIYKDNDPSKGTNQWVDQWRLPSEPFTFVVDRTGVIRQRFEGAFSAGELQRQSGRSPVRDTD